MNPADLAFIPATDLARLIRERSISPVELLETLLARIGELNPTLNAYCTLAPEQALRAAREAEKAVPEGNLGPLHGVPVAIKDLTLTAGIRTTFGSPIYKDNVPNQDALVVSRLKAAGAIVLGKTNTPELGAGINTRNALFGTTRNPWDTSRTPGGSSGGSASAVAAGLAPLAEGSDHGGSLRLPAAFCGIVALRTSPGLVPQYPSPWLSDFLSVTGPMARTVADTALMLSVMAGPDSRVPISYGEPGARFAGLAPREMAGLKVAWSRDLGLATVDPEVAAICERALGHWRSIGCTIEDDHPDFSAVPEMIPPLRSVRTAAVHQDLIGSGGAIGNDYLRAFLQLAGKVSALDVARAEALRSRLWEDVSKFFERYDLLITPATHTAAFPVEKLFPEEVDGRQIPSTVEAAYLNYAVTMTGLPAISVPCGFTAAGLPVGLQVVGRWRGDADLLSAAMAFEEAAPWSHLRPQIG